jgi:HSP20 family molecular chaperone IbpA
VPSITKRFFCSTLLLSALLAAGAALGEATAAPLEGGVEDTWVPPNRLPLNQWKDSVSPKLQPGLKWTDTLLPQPYTEDFWLPIPSWLAGVWHTEQASFIGGSGKRFGESSPYLSRHDDSFGYQRDKNGGIWHLVRYPFVSVTQADNNTSYFIDFTVSGNAKNSFHINLDADDIEVIVSKPDQKIQEVKHRHDSASWIKIGTSVSVDDLMTVNGAASHNGTIRTQPTQVGAFKRIDKMSDGYDVRASFHRFLVNSGKSDLIPADSASKVIK